MNKLLRFFITLLAVSLSLIGCSPPVGTIGSGRDLDDMWLEPRRVAYERLDKFVLEDDLREFGIYRGLVQAIPVDERLEIGIVEDPDDDPDNIVPFPFEEGFYNQWKGLGRKLIRVSYGGREDFYSVQIEDTYGIGPPGGEDSGGSGIIIIWRD